MIVVTAYASIESAVDAIKRGAVDYVPKPFTPDQIRLAAHRVVEAQRLRRRLAELQEELDRSGEPALFESRSPTFLRFLQISARAAASDAVLLLRGESGTGKNVLARWIRANSPRAHAPFVTVNCPALSGDLMTSALFGHRKDAFTGAVADVAGKVQEAEGGTLLLDEVGELTADAQARLLRFLNDRTYERLGEARERQADVQLITATNRDLEAEVRTGRFREDLFYRLNVVTLTLPPLRERPEDILLLAQHYLSIFSQKQRRPNLTFSGATHEFLDLTRIEAGQLRLNLEPVHIPAVVGETLHRVEGQAHAQGIALITHADPALPRIVADRLRLRAVFDNIVSNALSTRPMAALSRSAANG